MFNNPARPEWLAKQFRANELGKNYMLSTGRMNPWELPEFETLRNTLMKERDLGLSDYARNLTRTGVEGPGAALGLEKFNNQYSNRLLDLANKITGGATDRGLNVGNSILDQGMREKQLALQWQGQHDQRAAQPNDFMKVVQGIKAGTSALSDIADLGFGAAGLMGKLPIQTGSGTSGISADAQASLIQQLLQMLLKGRLS